MIKLLVLLVAILAFSSTTAEARIRRYKWEVKYEFKSPDCLKKLVIAINGRTPGPTIEAEQGDTVIVEVKNTLLTENLSIHWHGIRQVTLKFLFLFSFYSGKSLTIRVRITDSKIKPDPDGFSLYLTPKFCLKIFLVLVSDRNSLDGWYRRSDSVPNFARGYLQVPVCG